MLHLPDEVLVRLLCHPALFFGLRWGDFATPGGWMLTVPLKRVGAREEVATVIAETDLEWVCLRGHTMALEIFKVLEICAWAEAALDLLDHPTLEFGLRSLEE